MSTPALIWIIDDDAAIRFIIEDSLAQWGYRTESYPNGSLALKALQHNTTPPDLIISDIRMPELDGISLLKAAQKHYPQLPFLITTAYTDLDSTVHAYQTGAFDYLPKPFDLAELKHLVEQALRPKNNEKSANERSNNTSDLFDRDIIGQSPAMQQLYRAIGRLAKTTVNIVISGETGTGKELIARALHKHSPVANGEFIALNMAAIPAELAESELFGHEKGAFTGAHNTRLGRFAQAHNGTLFLDEIGDMSLPLQAKLLRALAEGSYYPIGSQTLKHSNARIITASHKNLERLVAQGQFREDLYHRLNVIHLHLPPLRERIEDIPALLEFHLSRAAKQHQLPRKKLSPAAKKVLSTYHWPGNIRQLENLCQQLTIMSPADIIDSSDLPLLTESRTQSNNTHQSTQNWQATLSEIVNNALTHNQPQLYQTLLDAFDHTLIQTALQHTNYHKQQAAAKLGIGRNTLTRKWTKTH